jgi:hypothetical protein
MSLFNGDTSSLKVGTGVKISWRRINPEYAYPQSSSEIEKIDKGIIVRVFDKVVSQQHIERVSGKVRLVTEKAFAVCNLNSPRSNIVTVKAIIELDIYSLSLEEMLTCQNKEVRALAMAIALLK